MRQYILFSAIIFSIYINAVFHISRLCQAEIAKRTLHLARNLLLLQKNEKKSVTKLLVRLISQLPLPEDYAQQELRPIVNMRVAEIMSQ